MKLYKTIAATAALLAGTMVVADTIELADGALLEGDFVGSSNGIVMFNKGEGIEAYPQSDVVGIFLSSGVATRQEEQIDGITVVPRGTQIYGRITSAKQANRLAGSSDISVVFTDIMINDQLHSMLTQDLKSLHCTGYR
jgi:hypothetical protein